jgi:hypothetical protein
VPAMQDKLLADFRTRLESDPQLRREFDAAPLGTLRKAGVQVTPERAQRFHREVGRGQYRPPLTTIAVSGQVQGKTGWLVAPVTVALSAQDFSGAGIAAIETSPDQASWVAYTGPFGYKAEGATRLYYRARDNAATHEQSRSVEFRIDTVAPVVVVSVDQTQYTRLQPFTAHINASDPAPGSGIATVTATLDATPVTDLQNVDLLWYALGTHVLMAAASDMAGWTTSRAASFELIATPDSVVGLIRKLAGMGQIDSEGVANSLVAKAHHRQFAALLHEISAQSDKHVTAKAADLLKADVEYVMAGPTHGPGPTHDPGPTHGPSPEHSDTPPTRVLPTDQGARPRRRWWRRDG